VGCRSFADTHAETITIGTYALVMCPNSDLHKSDFKLKEYLEKKGTFKYLMVCPVFVENCDSFGDDISSSHGTRSFTAVNFQTLCQLGLFCHFHILFVQEVFMNM
jgi:hypothetical protein